MHYLRLIEAKKISKRHVHIMKARHMGHRSDPHYFMREEHKSRKTKSLSSCSCWMCGNPRKYFQGKYRLTMQERRFFQD
jgi:hypothetical protein